MEYRYKPRTVEAAQWNPDRPGDVIGMLANHNIHWETYLEGLLVIDPKCDGIGVDPTDWVVIDEDGVEVFTDARFHDRYEARTTRSGSGVHNTINGTIGTGTVIQTGDHHGGLSF